jgi:hypothetical protein
VYYNLQPSSSDHKYIALVDMNWGVGTKLASRAFLVPVAWVRIYYMDVFIFEVNFANHCHFGTFLAKTKMFFENLRYTNDAHVIGLCCIKSWYLSV